MLNAKYTANFKVAADRQVIGRDQSVIDVAKMQFFFFFYLLNLIILCVSDSAYSASFNCNQASRPQEKFICQNEDVSKLDDALDKAYQEHMKVLTKDAQSLVQASQRSWLTYWPMTCSASSSALKLDANSKDCVLFAYRSRLTELNSSIAIEGRNTYKISEYRFIAPKTADEAPSNHTISFPQVIAQSQNDASINTWLARDLNKWRSGLDLDSDTGLSISLVASGLPLLHAIEVQYFFGHGAAHPQTNKAHLYFMPSAGRALNASDIFADKRWSAVLADFVFKKLQQKLGDNLQVSNAKELIPLLSQPSSWNISKNSFGLEFNPYEVAPYSEGFVMIEVPLSLVLPYLTPFAKSVFQSK